MKRGDWRHFGFLVSSVLVVGAWGMMCVARVTQNEYWAGVAGFVLICYLSGVLALFLINGDFDD